MSIQTLIKRCHDHLIPCLRRYLPPEEGFPLFAAMHYACLNGGKRLRPLLVYLSAELFDTTWEKIDPLACAIEFIHCYSLVHDDLPAMDNDDLRRGKPSCHKAYGEATAILAADALLTLAFEILSQEEHFPHLPPLTLLKILRTLAYQAGSQGMVKGQALDMQAESVSLSFPQLCTMHQAKTGALITASVQCGALATGRATEEELNNLQNFSQHLGLAFQIQDDILDAIGNSEIMGKHSGQDQRQNKSTFVTVLGLKAAKEQLHHSYKAALAALLPFGAKAEPLHQLSTYIVERVM